MFPPDQQWNPDIGWSSPAGRTLGEWIRGLASAGPVTLTVFGSAPLQLAMDSSFLSADVDVFSAQDLSACLDDAKLQIDQREVYVQQSDEGVFSASPSWRDRACTVTRDNVRIILPHPIIAPALQRRRAGYGAPPPYRDELRSLS